MRSSDTEFQSLNATSEVSPSLIRRSDFGLALRPSAGGGKAENLAVDPSWKVASLPRREGKEGLVRYSEAKYEVWGTED